MVKSFMNAFFGGIGRTLGKILVYLAIGLIFFFIYDEVHAAAIYGQSGCNSTYYNILKQDGTSTYGQTSTSYNISWETVSFYGTENLTANTYYDVKIVFRSNFTISALSGGPEVYSTSSLCGSTNGQLQVSGYGVSGATLTFRILTGSSMVDFWRVWTPFHFTGSNGINSVTFSKVDLSGSSGIIENANDNTNTIVNNNNQNTSDIINNQDSNTTDIINNQTQNTQDIINALDNTKYSVCSKGKQYFIIGSDKSYIANSSGQVNSNNNYFVSSPLRIDSNQSYTLNIVNSTNIQYGYYCFYKSDKTLISCTKYSDNTTLSYTFTSPNNSYYFVATLYRNNDVIENAYLEGKNANICITDSYNSSRQDLLNTMFQQDTSDGDTNIFSTWWNNFDPISNPLGSVVTLPITLAQKIVSFNSSSCQSINLGNLLGHNLTLTCFTLSSVLPDNASSLINTIDIIMSISLLVVIIKNTYETIANLVSLGGENEVKKQFRLPTPLEFMANLLNGGGN